MTNLPAGPASITATAGTPQNAVVNTAFATALQATVRDAGGERRAGCDGDVHGAGQRASASFASGAQRDGDDRRQRGGDGADADGEWDDGQLQRHGDCRGRGDAGRPSR